jgi:hypothetical protein
MLIKLIEITRDPTGVSGLKEIYVNSSHIISISEELSEQPLIKESLGLSEDIALSSVLLSEGQSARRATVIGSPSEINSKVKRRQVLRG